MKGTNSMSEKKRGTVSRWYDDKGYGFIRTDDGESIFAHFSNIRKGRIVKKYNPLDVVEFEIEDTEKGKAAKNINLIGKVTSLPLDHHKDGSITIDPNPSE